MTRIRAFVGHSFTSNDSEVVSRFSRMFDDLTHVMPEFSWDHAELSKPVSISEKVLSLTDDKNVFIAIYTRKELVLKGQNPPGLWGRIMLSAEDFEWKTSDWIIQETGLARGRNFPSIFFVETGVRPPSGLHADLEWIPFERTSPEKSFGKFLQMVGSLRDKPTLLVSGEGEIATAPPPPPVTDESIAAQPKTDWLEPRPEWSIKQFDIAFLRAIGSPEKQRSVDAAFEKSEHARNAQKRHGWEAFREWVLVSFDKGGDIERLRKATEEQPSNVDVRHYYGRALENFDQFPDAAVQYLAAAEHAESSAEKIRCLGDAADALRRADRPEESGKALSQARELAGSSREVEMAFLKKQREIAKNSANSELLIGTLERTLELEPSDVDARFSLAYAYDELGERELALYHYALIPYAARAGSTWNNLGVVRDHLGLPVLSVTSYKISRDAGETLAASNLANKYLDAGFLDEAEKLLHEAQKLPEFHKNILESLRRATAVGDEEDKKEEGIRNLARKRSEFYSSFGQASARPMPSLLLTEWMGRDFSVAVAISELSFVATGEFEEKTSALAIAMLPSGSTPPSNKIEIEYTGVIWGSAVIGTVSRRKLGLGSYLTNFISRHELLLYFEPAADRMHVLEFGKGHREQYVLEPVRG